LGSAYRQGNRLTWDRTENRMRNRMQNEMHPCRGSFFVSGRESYLYPICMQSDGERNENDGDAKTNVLTAPWPSSPFLPSSLPLSIPPARRWRRRRLSSSSAEAPKRSKAEQKGPVRVLSRSAVASATTTPFRRLCTRGCCCCYKRVYILAFRGPLHLRFKCPLGVCILLSNAFSR
jgi:hypothetical protein